jgi:hypothetical protein
MHDDFGKRLEARLAQESSGPEEDLTSVVERGRELRTRRTALSFLGGMAMVVLAYFAIASVGQLRDDLQPVIPGPTASALSTFKLSVLASADLTAPTVGTQLVATDELIVRESTAVIVSFSGPQEAGISHECVVGAQVRLRALGQPEGDSSIAVYPSRVFNVEEVEAEGRVPDTGIPGTLISNTPRAEPLVDPPTEGWWSWDVTEIYQQWFSERHFAGNYESVQVPSDEIVFSLRDESGEGPAFRASFASLEYAQSRPSDSLDAYAPTLALSIREGCEPVTSQSADPVPDYRFASFAVRAANAADVLDPVGYMVDYKRTLLTEDGATVFFMGSNYVRTERVETHKKVGPITFEIRNDRGTLRIGEVDGELPNGTRDKLFAYREPVDKRYPDLQFFGTTLLPASLDGDGLQVRTTYLVTWAQPSSSIPCKLHVLEDGEVVAKQDISIGTGGATEESRAGSIFGMGLPRRLRDANSARVVCN